MKLEIQNETGKIKAYEFRDRTDLEEVILSDSIEIIGEGAFKGCKNLRKLTVGQSVRQICPYALDGIGENLDLVWLSSLPYRSPFVKILPPFEKINSICAPKRSLEKAKGEERRALMCGYLLHPEREEEYGEKSQKEYKEYFQTEFMEQLNELCDRELILPVFLVSLERKMLTDKTMVKRFLSYIRARRTTKEEKDVIDQIEKEWKILETKEDVYKNRLRRYVRERMTDQRMQEILGQEGIRHIPSVALSEKTIEKIVGEKESNEKQGAEAPEEVIKYIVASYLSQWSPLEKRPSRFYLEEEADHLAEMLDPKRLLHALEQMTGTDLLAYPRKMIPLLRYGNDALVESILTQAETWSDYSQYGEEGILAKETLEKAILLNDSKQALLFVYRHGSLEQYARIHQKKTEELMLSVLDLMEEGKRKEEREEIMQKFIHHLHVLYLSGKKIKTADWEKYYMAHPMTWEACKGLVWETAQKQGKCFLMIEEAGRKIGVDEWGKEISLEGVSEVTLAHPVYMEKEQILHFQNIRKEKAITPCLEQLKILPCKLDLGDWENWNRRYEKLEISHKKLKQLTEHGFTLDGSFGERLRIRYYGKVLMEAYKTEEPDRMKLGYLLGSNYNMREINESCSILDEVFCYERILAGRTDASPYVEQFGDEELEQLLEASIEQNHLENIAVLLEQKNRRRQ